MSINVSKHRAEIVSAWEDVLDEKTGTDWALFGYEGHTNDLTVVNKGDGGIDEMKEDLNSSTIMYAFCKVMDPKTSLRKYVLINWQGEGTLLVRKGVCANHIRDVSNILKGFHVTINARTEEDVDSDLIIEKVEKSTASAYSFDERLDLTKDGFQKLDPAYKKVEPRKEINLIERDKFWAEEEEQEKQRQQQELKRKQEKQLSLEKEQMEREAAEANKREEMMTEMPVISETNAIKEDIKRLSELRKVENNTSSLSNNKSEELKTMRNKEAEELISKRTINARAIFEQNTSYGQLISNKKVSSGIDFKNSDASPKWQCKDTQSKKDGEIRPYSNGEEVSKTSNNIDNQTRSKESTNLLPSSVASVNPDNEEKSQSINGNDTGGSPGDILQAQALYDYQAADETEISFDPGDIITHVEQIDPGWWQGLAPDGAYGLFPANYVQLL